MMSFSRFLWRCHPLACIANILGQIGTRLTAVALVFALAEFVAGLDAGGVRSDWLWWLFFLAMLRAGFQALDLQAAVILGQVLATWVTPQLAAVDTKRTNAGKLSRSLSRDLRICQDDLSAQTDGLSLLIAMGITLAIILQQYSWHGAAALGIMVLFLPLSLWISHKSAAVYNDILVFSKRRIELALNWIRFGPYLRTWCKTEKFEELSAGLREENRLRNIDSVLQSLDSYVAQFGKIIPVALLFWLGSAEALWPIFCLSTPVLAMIMDIQRIYVAFRRGQTSFSELTKVLENTKISTKENQEGPLHFDNQSQLFSGTIAENLLVTLSEQHDWLENIGLQEELGGLDFLIERGGDNVSSGQATRILVLRALSLATAFGRKLIVDIELANLDTISRKKTLELIARQNNATLIHQHTLHFFKRTNPVQYNQTIDWRSFQRIFLSLFNYNFLLPLCAAIALALTGYFCFAGYLIYGLTASTLGLTLGIFGGYAIERRARENAKAQLERGLLHVILDDRQRGGEQIISTDYDMVLERLAFYRHDLSWFFALLAIAFISSFVQAKGYAIPALLMCIVCYGTLIRWLLPRMVDARRNMIQGLDVLLDSADASLAMGRHSETIVNDLRRTKVEQGMTCYQLARTRFLHYRAVVAIAAQFITAFCMVSIVYSLQVLGVSQAVSAMILTAFLAVDGEISRLFTAFAGFAANEISAKRLANFALDRQSVYPLAREYTDGIATPNFTNLRTGVQCVATIIPRFSVLHAASGAGKSQFLQAIAGLSPGVPDADIPSDASAPVPVYYFDKHWPEVAAFADPTGKLSITSIIDELKNKALIVFDEAFAHEDADSAKRTLETLRMRSHNQKGMSILVVDHRLVDLPRFHLRLEEHQPKRHNICLFQKIGPFGQSTPETITD